MSFTRIALRGLTLPRPALFVSRWPVNRITYTTTSLLKPDDVQGRIIGVLKGIEKIDSNKLSPSASFADDLGLDSLDTVEVVMAVEEEFSIEIPDNEADEIRTVQQAIDYIVKTPEAQ